MVNNYCPFCGRFMQMQDFEHACDQVAIMRDEKEWCSKCGGRINPKTDDMEKALCHRCMSRVMEWPGDDR